MRLSANCGAAVHWGFVMRRVFRFSVVLLALMLIVSSPAMAGDDPSQGNSFHASLDGWETGFIPGPFIPEGRCPAGTEWILQTAGGGEAAGFGTFDYTSEHCSRVLTLTPAGAVGKLAAGIMVLTFDDGELTVAYEGTWKFDGDLTTGEGIAKVHQSYEVVGGTGIFEGAKGHGYLGGVDDFHHILFDLRGSLKTAN
jgi:hypothetical protein